MRNQTPLAPNEPFDVTIHMVLNDFRPLGRSYVETDEAEADEATIVESAEQTPLNLSRGVGVLGASARGGCADGRLSSPP